MAGHIGRIPSDQKFQFEFPNFHTLNGSAFSTRPDRSCSILAWAHFTRQNVEGSWKRSCSKLLLGKKFNTPSQLVYSANSSLIFTWSTQTPFSCDASNLRTFLAGVCKPGELTHWKFGTTSPQFSRKTKLNIFVEDTQSRFKLWKITLHPV